MIENFCLIVIDTMKPNQKSEIKIFQYPPLLPSNSQNQTYASLDLKEKNSGNYWNARIFRK